ALAGGGFRLYYSAAGPGFPPSIHAAESADGVRWEKRGRVFSPNPDPDAFDARSVGSRSIIPWQGGYLMAYEAVSTTGVFSIGLATSPDALRWERLPARGPGGRVIALGEPGSWDEIAMGTPYFVPEQDGSLRLYYVGFSRHGQAGIGLIRCDGADITRWERYPA
ncbi:MAG: hypothetical protein NZ518_03495, partial [Dehalococcoidia bacterium]|nr:hypothetical protein [Dehalococcoidia bacterium]